MGGVHARAVRGQAKKLIEVARALYEQDDAEGLRDLGFDDEDLAGDEIRVWPENREAAELFVALGTQWRHGMNGPTGLVYGEIDGVAARLGIEVGRERFLDLRLMEIEALKTMSEAREADARKRRKA